MCGIFGCVGKIDREKLQQCLYEIRHRGPDAMGIKELQGISLAHARLSILDTNESANQPMSDQSGRYWIVYNGEVYNYVEIRKELEGLGYRFRTKSDTEIILYSYIEWGADFQKKCNGMWGLAIWDNLKKELFVSRDRFGVKPFYYYEQGGNFYFASEMKAFFPIMDQKKINYVIFESKNYLGYEATENCCIRDIKKVQAGYCGYFRNGELELYRWWDTLDNLIKVPQVYEEQVEYLRELFLDACKIRMRSDVPIGTALSGGVDSSSVIGAMSYISNKSEKSINRDWQHAFVASMPGTNLDETIYAQKAADYVKVDLQKVMITAKDAPEQLLRYMYICEDPHITTPIPFMQTYKEMSTMGVKVTLDGHGVDELFGGYLYDIINAANDVDKDMAICTELWRIYNDGVAEEYRLTLQQFMLQIDATEGKSLNEHLYTRSHKNILPTLLRCYDRYSMGNSVEIRMPFMDYRIVSFAFSIPWDSKIRNGYTKNIIRDMASPFMDPEIIYKKRKVGFNTPFTEWLQGDMKEFILDEIHSQDFYNCELLNPLEATICIHDFYSKKRTDFSDGDLIWNKVMPYFWKKAMGL